MRGVLAVSRVSGIEARTRYAGVLFYLVFVLFLSSTESGMKFIQALPGNLDLSQVIITVIAVGVAFFTSEPIGFVFNSLYVFLWNAKGGRRPEFGGYAAEWKKKLSYDFAEKIVEYKAGSKHEAQEQGTQASKERWKEYGPDVFLSYFWQQAPPTLVQWVSRRHTALFVANSGIVAIASALLLSTIPVTAWGMGVTAATYVVVAMSLVLAFILYYNGRPARTEAWQMIDLWMHQAFDPQMGKALDDIMGLFSSGKRKTVDLKPSFKVMRVNDVKMRESENDRRLFYFDKDVDIVSTTISKAHTEPSHLHTVNTESYYVIHGKLLFNVEGQDIWLRAGDMIVVNPGSCHHFKTTDEEVVFLAIKKEPGLSDKKPCSDETEM
jgi:quercetin dioxygenase-like cupin family protein